MCGGPQEYITYELVPASAAVSCMSGSSNLNSFRDRRDVAVQLWKTFRFQAIQFCQAVLIQLIQLSESTDFVYTQLNVKRVLC